MSMMRMAIVGTGAAGAAGVAVFGGPMLDAGKSEKAPTLVEREICLKGDLPLFEGVDAKCYSRAEFRALLDRAVLDAQGEPILLTMSHPSDRSAASATSSNCRQFREMAFDGWYAASSREMRREASFVRACGALAALDKAQDAKQSFFTNGSPNAEDMAVMVSAMRFGEASAENLQVDQASGHVWRITADAITVQIHEIANADFDNDGIEEVLAFSAGAPVGGTASFYDVGLIEKDSAEAALIFTQLSYGRNEASGVGG
jgi:hypothetical protein